MDSLRLTHVVVFSDPGHPGIKDWLARYTELFEELSEGPFAPYADVDIHMRRQRRMVTAEQVYEVIKNEGGGDTSQQTGRTMSFLWAIPRIRFYCAGFGHVRGECECAVVVQDARGMMRLNSPRYCSLQGSQKYRQWCIDHEDVMSLTLAELNAMPKDIALRWGRVIELLEEVEN